MDTRQKAYYISLVILLICLLITALVYLYTGQVILIILFAPPLVYWLLKSQKSDYR